MFFQNQFHGKIVSSDATARYSTISLYVYALIIQNVKYSNTFIDLKVLNCSCYIQYAKIVLFAMKTDISKIDGQLRKKVL